MKTNANGFSHYYLAYCRANGKTPEAMLAHDEAQWPGSCMAGFIFWINKRWGDWRVSVGRKNLHGLSEQERAAFSAFLEHDDARKG